MSAAAKGVKQPRVLPGFEQIRRYWDPTSDVWAAKILPGEFYVSRGGEMIVTTLGSCVAACARDPERGVGGMNHFLLPLRGGDPERWALDPANLATRYGNHAMEQLINRLLELGARRENLEIKLFGGGRVLKGITTDVGKRNGEFALEYCDIEGLNVLANDLGGLYPRKVRYFPETGRALCKKLYRTRNETLVEREKEFLHELEEEPVSGGDVDLFE